MARRKRHGPPKVKEDVSANVIPMVDIMFLLLLFFMLSADMAARDLVVMDLPVANTAINDKEDEKGTTDADADRKLLNIAHLPEGSGEGQINCVAHAAKQMCRADEHWVFMFRSTHYPNTKEGRKELGQLLTEVRREWDRKWFPEKPEAGPTTGPSEMTLMIRADRLAPYGYIQHVMAMAAQAFVYRVQVGAGMPGDERK